MTFEWFSKYSAYCGGAVLVLFFIISRWAHAKEKVSWPDTLSGLAIGTFAIPVAAYGLIQVLEKANGSITLEVKGACIAYMVAWMSAGWLYGKVEIGLRNRFPKSPAWSDCASEQEHVTTHRPKRVPSVKHQPGAMAIFGLAEY